jgi:enoyl-CoA hydratase/carnithine racemase
MTTAIRNIPLPTTKVLARVENGIGWLTFNQPEKRNAISMEMWQAISTVADIFKDDASVRVVVLSGAGGKSFAAGADISEFEKSRASADNEAKYAKISTAARISLENLGKPVIAMIQGFCIGGGLGTALLADIRIATPESVFAIPAARLSIAYGATGLRRLVALVGPSVAKDILFSARKLSATEALSIGLINRIVDADKLVSEVTQYALTIAANAPLSIQYSRMTVDMIAGDLSDYDTARIDAMYKTCFNSADYAEGRRAFMEKRPPVFTGK